MVTTAAILHAGPSFDFITVIYGLDLELVPERKGIQGFKSNTGLIISLPCSETRGCMRTNHGAS